MLKKLLWGFGVLVLLVCTALVFMTVRNLAEIRQLKEEADAIEKSLEDGNKPKSVVKADEHPAAEEGFKWVWHNDHWDKVPIANLNQPVKHNDVQNTDVSVGNSNLPVGDGNPLDEDFYRNNYSKEELAANKKSSQEVIEQLQTVNIPHLEESRKKLLDLFELVPENPNIPDPRAERLTDVEARLNWYKGIAERLEERVATISNVLKEEVNDVEK